MTDKETYRNRDTRDKRARELKREGYTVVRRSTGPCRLHPQYVRDWPYTFEVGFGNTDYLTMHGNLYVVEFSKNSY